MEGKRHEVIRQKASLLGMTEQEVRVTEMKVAGGEVGSRASDRNQG